MEVRFVKPDDIRLKIKHRMRYDEVLSQMARGFVMLIKCDRKKASYIKDMLNKHAKKMFGKGISVEHSQAIFNDEMYYAFFLVETVDVSPE